MDQLFSRHGLTAVAAVFVLQMILRGKSIRIEHLGTPGNGFEPFRTQFCLFLSRKGKLGLAHIVLLEKAREVKSMERSSKIILLAAVSIAAVVGLTTVAYAQTYSASAMSQCRSMMGTGGMGMMGGQAGMMGQSSSMQGNCQSMMGQNGMAQCQNMTAQNMAQCQEMMRQ